MRIFYHDEENELKYVDTKNTPIFLSVRPEEKKFLTEELKDDTDSIIFIKDGTANDPNIAADITVFIEEVSEVNRELNVEYISDRLENLGK